MTTYYSPAETVERTGFSLDTLRYYEKAGLLLDAPHRASSGHRRFSDDDLAWLGTLACLRDTGMPIAEMRRYAELCREGDHTIPERIALLETHNSRVEDHIGDLLSKKARVEHKLDWYREYAQGNAIAGGGRLGK
ncbi:MerR family transcriptional regulator [Actinorhabdospora filicis]|uniref:MerR family transcriptional regulator n=1 Tax=Actinorhabdospora filicis TaxID=1785913 RepID=A0A9W6SIA2_9ACTN|nr:MerR family transcriptional regulator [Actinorhabdospora filicis]GLZ76337.1 MerR family transcriptional regulator [Actinorhabdospora filicis]